MVGLYESIAFISLQISAHTPPQSLENEFGAC